MGGMHAQAYGQLSKAQLTAAVEADPARAKKALKMLGLDLPVYPNLKALLAAEDVDVVDVCLPTDEHAENALAALKAGKHVFCEKPLARSVKEAEAVAKAADKADGFFMVGLCIRFWPEYQSFVDFVKSKKAGKLLSLTMQRRSSRPLASSKNWLQNSKRSGGAVFDLHIHDTDFVHHLLGAPKSVTSVGTRDFAGYSHIFTQYEFKNVAVSAEGGWNYPPNWGFQMAFQAIFEKGAVEYDSRANPSMMVTLGNAKPAPLPFKAPSTKSSSTGEGNISSLGGYFNELQYFINCLEAGKAPKLATAWQACESLRTVFAEIESADKGREVKL